MKLDQIIAVCMFILGAIYLWLALTVRQPIMREAVGPGAFPTGVAVAIMLCAVWLFIQALLSDEPKEELEPRDPDYTAMGAVFAGLLGYGLLLNILGYFVTTVAFLVLTIAALETGRSHWLRTILISVTTSYAVFLVFDSWLGVTLPSGFIL